MDASQTRDYCVAAFLSKSSATHRAARPDPFDFTQGRLSPRKVRLLGMTIIMAPFFGANLKLYGDRVWDDQKESNEQEGKKESR